MTHPLTPSSKFCIEPASKKGACQYHLYHVLLLSNEDLISCGELCDVLKRFSTVVPYGWANNNRYGYSCWTYQWVSLLGTDALRITDFLYSYPRRYFAERSQLLTLFDVRDHLIFFIRTGESGLQFSGRFEVNLKHACLVNCARIKLASMIQSSWS